MITTNWQPSILTTTTGSALHDHALVLSTHQHGDNIKLIKNTSDTQKHGYSTDTNTDTVHTKIQSINTYSTYTDTLYTQIQCIHRYSIYTDTVHNQMQNIHYTVQTQMHYMHIYGAYNTVYTQI